MDWTRLLILGRECDEIASRISLGEPELDITARSLDSATESDVRHAQMLLGFRIPDRLVPAASALLWVQSTGAGVDLLLASGAISATTLLTRVVGVFGPQMSDYVLLHCLAIAQDVERQRDAQRRRQWDVFYPRRLSELTVLVLGTGEVGGAIARRLKANGAGVVGVNRTGHEVDGIDAVVPLSQLADVLSSVDVLVIVVPNTESTRSLIGAREIAMMRSGAWLVNVARGSCIDEAALLAALQRDRGGHLGGAVLDVFEHEPLPPESPLWGMDNVRISPHISGLTRPDDAATAFLDNFRRLRRGEPARGVVDRDRGY